jgi:hypothetical protein
MAVGASNKVVDGGTATNPLVIPATTTSSNGLSTFVLGVVITEASYIQSIVDSKGNTYTQRFIVNNYSGTFDLLIFSADANSGAVGGSNHTFSITKSPGNETAEVTMLMMELTNTPGFIAADGQLDATNPVTSPSITTTSANEQLVSFLAGDGFSSNYTMTATDFTTVVSEQATGGNTAQCAFGYRQVATVGSYLAEWNSSPAQGGGSIIARFSPDGPTISVQPTSRRVNEGSAATFNITTGGSETLQLQTFSAGSWANVSGATSNSYTTPATVKSTDDGKAYRWSATLGSTIFSDTFYLFVSKVLAVYDGTGLVIGAGNVGNALIGALDPSGGGNVYFVGVTEAVSATDSVSAQAVFNVSATESATATDQVSATAIAIASVTESVSAAESVNAQMIAVAAVTETANATDSTSSSIGAASYNVTVTETANRRNRKRS